MSKNIIEELEKKPEKKKKSKKNKPVNVFASLFFITLGIVFLLNNLGILPWGIWSILWRFWPIFLIMAGLQILAGRSWIASVIVFGLGIGLISTVVVYSLSLTNSNIAEYIDNKLPIISSLREYLPTNPGNLINNKFITRSTEYENIDKVIIEMDLGAGKFNVQDTDEDFFIQVNADYYEDYGKPEIRTEQQGHTLIIKLGTIRSTKKLFGGVDELNYDIFIGKQNVPKDIKIKVGAGKMDAEFDNTEIHVFESDLGAGTINVDLEGSSLPEDKMDLEVGAGSMNIHLPQKTFAKFDYQIGVGALDVDGERLKGTGEFTMTNFSITNEPLPINVSIGAGTININF